MTDNVNTSQQQPATQNQSAKRNIEVVTHENIAEYQAKKLGLTDIVNAAPSIKEESKVEEKTETKTDSVAEIVQTQEKSKEKENDSTDKVVKKATNKLEKRFSELAEEKRQAESRAELAERKARELEERFNKGNSASENKNSDERPIQSNYTDAFKYAEDLAEWKTRQILKEKEESDRKAKVEEERLKIFQSWDEKVDAIREEVKDFDDIMANSEVKISNEIRDAIIESDIGPKILLHLAQNPKEAEKIGKLTVGKALIALGKMEAKLTEVPKKEESIVKTKEPEMSKAPPPINPLHGASTPVDIHSEFTQNTSNYYTSTPGNFAKYKEARRTGKIK